MYLNCQIAIQRGFDAKRERKKRRCSRTRRCRGGKEKKSQPPPPLEKTNNNSIIALSVPAGPPAPAATEAAPRPCAGAPLRLALEPRRSAENGDGEGGPVYAAVALAGGGVARLEVTLPSSSSSADAAPSLLLRSGHKETKSKNAEAAGGQTPSSPSPSKAKGGGGGDKKKEDRGGDNGGNSNNNHSNHSPVGAAGRAVAGLTAAAVGALPRALFRTFSGNSVSAASGAAGGGVEVKCLAFSRDASLLACGGEDGVVRLLSWPGLELVSEVRPAGPSGGGGGGASSAAAASSAPSTSSGSGGDGGVRDLDFGPPSTDGRAHLLACVLDSGAASVWRVGPGASSGSSSPAAPLAVLPPPPTPSARPPLRAADHCRGQGSRRGQGQADQVHDCAGRQAVG